MGPLCGAIYRFTSTAIVPAASETERIEMFEARHSHPSHWRMRIALLVFGTILSIAAAIFVLYWGACAHTVAAYAQSAASVERGRLSRVPFSHSARETT